MNTILLIYDIPDDRLRSKVADARLDSGLDRVAHSAFLGRGITGYVTTQPLRHQGTKNVMEYKPLSEREFVSL